MSERQKRAKELHNSGYNCAQSFICSYKDELGIDEKQLFRLTEGLGRGISGLEETCCVPILIAMIISYLETSDGDIANPQSKLNSYACGKCLIMEFKEKIGTLKCSDILQKHHKCHGKQCCTDILMEGIDILDNCLNQE